MSPNREHVTLSSRGRRGLGRGQTPMTRRRPVFIKDVTVVPNQQETRDCCRGAGQAAAGQAAWAHALRDGTLSSPPPAGGTRHMANRGAPQLCVGGALRGRAAQRDAGSKGHGHGSLPPRLGHRIRHGDLVWTLQINRRLPVRSREPPRSSPHGAVVAGPRLSHSGLRS